VKGWIERVKIHGKGKTLGDRGSHRAEPKGTSELSIHKGKKEEERKFDIEGGGRGIPTGWGSNQVLIGGGYTETAQEKEDCESSSSSRGKM